MMRTPALRIFPDTACDIETLREDAESDGVAPELFFAALLAAVAAEAVRLELTASGFGHLFETAFMIALQAGMS